MFKTLSELIAITAEEKRLHELFADQGAGSDAGEEDDDGEFDDETSDERDAREAGEKRDETGEKVLWVVTVKRSDGQTTEKRARASSIEAIQNYFGADFVDAYEDTDEEEPEVGASTDKSGMQEAKLPELKDSDVTEWFEENLSRYYDHGMRNPSFSRAADDFIAKHEDFKHSYQRVIQAMREWWRGESDDYKH